MEKEKENEIWKEVELGPEYKQKQKIEVSNLGGARRTKHTGRIWPIKIGNINGYASITITLDAGGNRSKYLHKVIAETFLEKESDDQVFVIHKDYEKLNNNLDNLAWADKQQKEKHQFKNPLWIKNSKKVKNAKLTEAKVRKIRKMVNDPNRTMRMKKIAEKFGISEMHLYRIKKGKNWSHVK